MTEEEFIDLYKQEQVENTAFLFGTKTAEIKKQELNRYLFEHRLNREAGERKVGDDRKAMRRLSEIMYRKARGKEEINDKLAIDNLQRAGFASKIFRYFKRFLGNPNLHILWDYWQKNIYTHTYVPSAIITYHRRVFTMLMSTISEQGFTNTLDNKKPNFENLLILLNLVFKPESEHSWFKLYYSKMSIWYIPKTYITVPTY